MSHLLHYLPTTLVNNELIEYNLVKYQHDYILHLFKLLKDKIKTHILTEESLMNYRNEKKPDNHINVESKLNKHKEKHNDLLENLDSIKEDFETHIKLCDNFHIHKL
jgi:hypothetical protein